MTYTCLVVLSRAIYGSVGSRDRCSSESNVDKAELSACPEWEKGARSFPEKKKKEKKRPITPSIHGGGFVLLDLLRAANSLLQLRTNVYDLLPVLQTVV